VLKHKLTRLLLLLFQHCLATLLLNMIKLS